MYLRSIEIDEKRMEQVHHFAPNYPIALFAFMPIADSVLIERNRLRTWKQFSEATVKRLNREYQIPTNDEKSSYQKIFWIGENTADAIRDFLLWWN